MGGPPTYTHQIWRRSEDPPKDLGGDREHTNKQMLLEL